MFRMLIHPSSGACDLFVELFHGLYCSGSMCVGVTLWFWLGWCGIHMQTEALFNAQHVSDVYTSILKSLDLFVELFHGLYCSRSICVGVTLWFGCGGVVSVCRLKHYLMFNVFRMY